MTQVNASLLDAWTAQGGQKYYLGYVAAGYAGGLMMSQESSKVRWEK